MYKPKFYFVIRDDNFPQDDFICLGKQMIYIIYLLKKYLEPHTWFGGNVNTLNEVARKYGVNSFFLKKIGDDDSFIKLCAQVDQFFEGVFFAIKNEFSSQPIDQIKVDTEDEQFRSLPIQGVLIEIRTFDTSFFEIYSEDKKVIEKLALKFNSEIEIAKY